MGTAATYRVFGDVAVDCPDGDVVLGRGVDRCLFGLLVLRVNRAVDIDTLIHLLWGEQRPRSARKQVTKAVARIRQRTTRPDAAVLTIGARYQFTADPLSVDLHRAVHLLHRARYEASPGVARGLVAQAVALQKGPVLEEFANARVQEFIDATVGADLAALAAAREELTAAYSAAA